MALVAFRLERKLARPNLHDKRARYGPSANHAILSNNSNGFGRRREIPSYESRVKNYLVILEQGKNGGRGAYAPDLPGFGVAADTREEVEILIREGIVIHIEALREEGFPVPEPSSLAELVSVSIA